MAINFSADQAGYSLTINYSWSTDYTADRWWVYLDGTIVAGGQNARSGSGFITVPDYGTYTVSFDTSPYTGSESVSVLVEEPPPPPTGPYIWNGSEWKKATPYIWNGSQWVQASANIWDGNQWKS